MLSSNPPEDIRKPNVLRGDYYVKDLCIGNKEKMTKKF